jgi:pilus assembly protein CpaE
VDFEYDSETFLRLMRSGVRELLPFPTNSPKALEAIENISKLVKRSKPQYPNPAPIYCFLPAKPGVGASTLAVNTAMAAAARLNKGALLCDLDTNVGMSAFLLRVSAENSIREAIGCAGRLDEDIWKQVVAPRGDLDVLGPGTLGPAEEFSPAAVEAVIRFASRIYDAIFIDCSGNLEPYCVNLLSSAKQIFLVCTHEVAALHLGRMKAEALKGLDLQDRVTVLLNRSESGHALSIKEVEKLLEFRVRYSFSNDYKRVNQGAMTTGIVDPRSDLGKQFKQFAESLGGAAKTGSGEPAPKRRFLEYFAVKPSSFTLHGGQR